MRLKPAPKSAIAPLAACLIALSGVGCARTNSGPVATITVKGSYVPPSASPTPSAYTASRFDADSQAGTDDVQVHQTSSGWTVTGGAISGNAERAEASSAKFNVNGGIYVQ